MKLKSVKDLDVSHKRVLVRLLLNTPLENGKVASDFRIRAVLPTLQYLTARQSKVVVLSKVKRPFDEDGVWKDSHSLRPFVDKLAELLHRKLIVLTEKHDRLPDYDAPHLYFFTQNIEQTDISPLLSQMKDGDVAVLENIRFYKGEMDNDPAFAKLLAGFGDVYINDAFGDSHSGTANHTSIVGLPKLLPSAAGLNMLKEVEALSRATVNPKKPVVLMMGGIKLSTKSDVLKNLGRTIDAILLGGGIANLLIKAMGYEIGKSKVEAGEVSLAKQFLRDLKGKLYLPTDVVVSNFLDGDAECVQVDQVKPHQLILDIGPATIRKYSDKLREGRTLIWNGPMGLYEQPQFSHGTMALARFFASRTKGQAYGVAGGGETVDALTRDGLLDYVDHVSTGGGALLDFLGGKKMPGIELLRE